MTGRFIGQLMAASAFIALVSACGDGGNSGSGAPPIGSAPTPSPTPAPTPVSSKYPPAPFNVTEARQYFVLGWIRPADDEPHLERGEYQFGWGKSPDTYRLTIPEISGGLLVYTFPGNNPYAFSVFRADGSKSDLHASVVTGVVNAIPFKHVGQLYVHREVGDSVIGLGTALFGIETPLADIPTSGTQSFQFFEGSNKWEVMIDYSTNQVTGLVAIYYEDAWGPYDPSFYTLVDGKFDRSTGEIQAVFDVPESSIKGSVSGRLMGPDATELALAFSGPVYNPYTLAFERRWFVRPGNACPQCE